MSAAVERELQARREVGRPGDAAKQRFAAVYNRLARSVGRRTGRQPKSRTSRCPVARLAARRGGRSRVRRRGPPRSGGDGSSEGGRGARPPIVLKLIPFGPSGAPRRPPTRNGTTERRPGGSSART